MISPHSSKPLSRRAIAAIVTVLATTLAVGGSASNKVSAESYQRISGEGSSWAFNAIDAMRVNVEQFGITVDYSPSGSSKGRTNFLNGTVDFAASDIPFQFNPEDGSAPESPTKGSYAYMPVTAGGTAFMYNLQINGKRVTNLRLSGANVAKIFTGAVTMWNDPAIQADNPGLTLPGRTIVPVVRSDGSGSTAQLTLWMIDRFPDIWTAYCNASGRAPACGSTSFYPTVQGMISQSGDTGVAGYVSQGFAEGAIGYVNYSYALGAQFPVAKVLNAAGFYTEPTPQNVAVSLLQARINTDESDPATYLTQNLAGVYTDADPRSYQLSSYSYLILPTVIAGQFNEQKGKTLGAFSYYAMCQAQQQSASLGYSPMPINLVQAGLDQIRKIPGVVVQDVNIATCKNPTFAPDGSNLLADQTPQPQACDRQGTLQCADGTGGLSGVPTAISAAASGAAAAAAGSTPAPGSAPVAGVTPAAAGAPAADASAAAGGAPTSGDAAASGGVPASGVPASGGAPASGATPSAGATPAGGTTPAAGTAAPGAVAPGVTTDPGLTAGDPAAPAVVVTGQGCDPDTGICAAIADPETGQVAQAATVGAISTTTLNRSASSGSSLALVLLVVLLTLGLILAPAAAWRHYASRVEVTA